MKLALVQQPPWGDGTGVHCIGRNLRGFDGCQLATPSHAHQKSKNLVSDYAHA